MGLKIDLSKYQKTDEGGSNASTPSLKLDLSRYAKPMEVKTEAISNPEKPEIYTPTINKSVDTNLETKTKEQTQVKEDFLAGKQSIDTNLEGQFQQQETVIPEDSGVAAPIVEKPQEEKPFNLMDKKLTYSAPIENDSPIKRLLKTVGEKLNIIDTDEETALKQSAQYKVEKELKRIGYNVTSKDVEKNFTEYKRIAFPEVSYDPTKMEVLEGLMGAGLVASVVMNPTIIPVALKGIGTFAAVSEGVNLGVSKLNKEQYQFAAGKGLQDIEVFKKSDINSEFLEFTDLLVKMGVTGFFGKVYKNLFWQKVQDAQIKGVNFIDNTKITDSKGKATIFNKKRNVLSQSQQKQIISQAEKLKGSPLSKEEAGKVLNWGRVNIEGKQGQKLVITQDKNRIRGKLYVKETTLENMVNKLRTKKTATGEKINPFSLVENDLSQSMSKALQGKPIKANIVQDGIEFVLPTTAKPMLESVSNIDLTKSPTTNENIQGGMISPLKTEKITVKELPAKIDEIKSLQSKNITLSNTENKILETTKNISKEQLKLFRTSDDGKIEFDTSKPEAQKIISEMFGDKYSQDFFKTYDKAIIEDNKIALGFYENDFINLFENNQKVSSRATYHESFHKFYNTMLSKNEQQYLSSKYGDEESLARDFEDFVIKEKNGKQKTNLIGRIRYIFEKLYNSIKNFLTGRKKIEKYFNDLLQGKYKEKEVSKGLTEYPKRKGVTFEEFEKASKEGFSMGEEKSREQRLKEIYGQKKKTPKEISLEKKTKIIADKKAFRERLKSELSLAKTPQEKIAIRERFDVEKRLATDYSIQRVVYDKVFGVTLDRLKEIAPEIWRKSNKGFFERWQDIDEKYKQAEGFLNKVLAIEKNKTMENDWDNMLVAMRANDNEKVSQLMKKFGLEKEDAEFRKIADGIFEKLVNMGYSVGYLKNYYPSSIKQDKLKEFQEMLDKKTNGSVNNIIEQMEVIRGHKLNDTEKLGIINDLINKQYSEDNQIIKGSGFMKHREIDIIDKDMLRFYEPLSVSIQKYVESSSDSIMRAKMLGHDIAFNLKSELITLQNKGFSQEEYLSEKKKLEEKFAPKIKGTITYDFFQMAQRGELTSQKEQLLRDMIFNLYNPNPATKFMKVYSALQTLFLLGKFENSLTQLTEIRSSFVENPKETPGAIVKVLTEFFKTKVFKKSHTKNFIKLEDIGIGGYQEDYKNEVLKGKIELNNVVDVVLKSNGFRVSDMIPKSVKVNSDYMKLKNNILKKDPSILKSIREIVGEDFGRVIDDIKNDNITEDVKLVLYTKHLEYQSLSPLELPEQYLKGGTLWKMFYKFRPFLIKQASALNRKGFGEMYKGLKYRDGKRFWKGFRYFMLFTLSTMALIEIKNIVKDLLHNKKHDPKNATLDTVAEMQPFLNRYNIGLMQREGIAAVGKDMVFPPLAPVENIIKDIFDIMGGNIFKFQTIKYMPLFGDILYNNVFGGTTSTSSNLYYKPSSSGRSSGRSQSRSSGRSSGR